MTGNRRRWEGTTEDERRAVGRQLAEARSAKRQALVDEIERLREENARLRAGGAS